MTSSENLLFSLVEAVTNATRIPVSRDMIGELELQLRLPVDVSCVQCVIQWKYNAGRHVTPIYFRRCACEERS